MKAQGLARIGKDAEVRFTQGGDAVASISLAFNYGKKDPQTGKKPTQWVDAALWGKRAESLAPYLKKGTQIVAYLEDVHIETFTKQDGTQASKLAAKLADLELVSGSQEEPQQYQQAPQQAPQQQAPQRPPMRPIPPPKGNGFDDMDDDVPF